MMNRKQRAYQYGCFVNGNSDLYFLSKAMGWGALSGLAIATGFGGGGLILTGAGVAAGYFGTRNLGAAVKFAAVRHLTKRGMDSGSDGFIVGTDYIAEHETEFPYECASSVVIDDIAGFMGLMHCTALGSKAEWGTVHEAHVERDRAVIHKIEDIGDVVREGLVYGFKSKQLKIDIGRVVELGYNGYHHCHVMGNKNLESNADNYAINFSDRMKPADWINLLSFNMPWGPEIIAFNRRFVYLPVRKQGNVLRRADKRTIMDYLSD